MIIRTISLTLSALLLYAGAACALSLDEAVRLALDHSYKAKDQARQAESGSERVKSGKAPFMPALDLSYSFSRRDNVFFFQTKDASTLTAEISYNLFNGFSDLNTLKSTKSLHEAALYQKKAVEADVVLQATRAFTELLRARKNLEVTLEAVELLERQVRDVSLYYREGIVAKNEQLKVEVELASARQDHLKADSRTREARRTLELLTGIEVAVDSLEEQAPYPEVIPIDLDLLDEKMIENRSEIQFLKAQRRAREFSKKSIRGAYYPSVDLRFTHSRYGDSPAPTGRDNIFDTETVGAVEAEWNLFDGFRRRHRILSEESEIRALDERINNTTLELRLQLNQAVEGYRVSSGRLEVARKAIEQAEENYRITDNQFRQRVATSTDLLDARVFLTRAKNDYNNSLYDMYLAIAEIERVMEQSLRN